VAAAYNRVGGAAAQKSGSIDGWRPSGANSHAKQPSCYPDKEGRLKIARGLTAATPDWIAGFHRGRARVRKVYNFRLNQPVAPRLHPPERFAHGLCDDIGLDRDWPCSPRSCSTLVLALSNNHWGQRL